MINVVRNIRKGNTIIGEMYFNGSLICYTLENASKAIPCGQYVVQNSKSPKFKRELPLVFNSIVSSSRGIRIHCGNKDSDSAGCILVGMGRNIDNMTISESKMAESMITAICRSENKLIITDNVNG